MFVKKIFCYLLITVFCTAFLLNACQQKGDIKSDYDNAAATTEKKHTTYTGMKPLDTISFSVKDPDNIQKLPSEKIEHAYGVAKNSAPHSISVSSQKSFESKGYRAVTFDTSDNEKLLYLTFDCGYENGNTSKILDVLKENGVKAAFFCTLDDIKAEPDLISRMIKEGHIVGNHSTTHPSFPELSRKAMAKEIEHCENYLRQYFGYSSKYFRFPKGEYSENALELVGSLGYTSVFWSLAYSDWDVNNQKGEEYAFEKVTSRLHPGAIILLHSVSKDNADALDRIISYAIENGYSFKTLDDLTLPYFK